MCCCDERRRRSNPVDMASIQAARNLVTPVSMPSIKIPHRLILTPEQQATMLSVAQKYKDNQTANMLALNNQPEKKSKILPIAIGAVGIGAAVFFLTR